MIRLEFEITHLCNKYCPLCDHRIRWSNYKFLTFKQYNKVVSFITSEQKERIYSVFVIGGEPLCHPYFETLIKKMHRDFPKSRIVVSTNGRLLPLLTKEVFNMCIFTTRIYKGWNDDVLEIYKNHPNVINESILRDHADAGLFQNPFLDLNLPEDMAKEIDKKCIHQIRIIGTKLYKCCMAEGIERMCKTDPIHIEFDKNWLENWKKIPNWRACAHCRKTINWFVSLNDDGSCYLDKKKRIGTSKTKKDKQLIKKYKLCKMPKF